MDEREPAVSEKPRIFIAYRREDVSFKVDRLFNDIKNDGAFDPFRDVDSLRIERYEERINAELDAASAVLVAIGPGWLHAVDEDDRQRLTLEGDLLRKEIEGALAREVKVVPVLLEGADMPERDELPPSLQDLHSWHAFPIDSAQWSRDSARLIEMLKSEIGAPAVAEAADTSTEATDTTNATTSDTANDTEASATPQSQPQTAWVAGGVLLVVAMIVLVLAVFD
ncbi:MAG: TIR domain-containing protein [Ilumatobacter sp.]|uniref:TIR domain-containing protein n=1 Tax=Ilumatobacter sp. TaxID=1967498 RepID=UPI002613B39C|nr:TIR domain-containing protein [Ilumatobacter sp.]MDJ0770597.1 TIR domain-containing protein [Ilumatobacter sp.]